MFTVTVEVEERVEAVVDVMEAAEAIEAMGATEAVDVTDVVDVVREQLAGLHAELDAAHGWLSAVLDLQADGVAEAAALGVAAVEQATGRAAVSVTAVPKRDYGHRLDDGVADPAA